MTKLPPSKYLARAAATGLLLAGTCLPGAFAVAGEAGLTNLQNAKVAHHLAKQRMLEGQKSREERERDAQQEDQSCGSIDIGNVRAERGVRAPREVITVVRGDVINTGRCR